MMFARLLGKGSQDSPKASAPNGNSGKSGAASKNDENPDSSGSEEEDDDEESGSEESDDDSSSSDGSAAPKGSVPFDPMRAMMGLPQLGSRTGPAASVRKIATAAPAALSSPRSSPDTPHAQPSPTKATTIDVSKRITGRKDSSSASGTSSEDEAKAKAAVAAPGSPRKAAPPKTKEESSSSNDEDLESSSGSSSSGSESDTDSTSSNEGKSTLESKPVAAAPTEAASNGQSEAPKKKMLASFASSGSRSLQRRVVKREGEFFLRPSKAAGVCALCVSTFLLFTLLHLVYCRMRVAVLASKLYLKQAQPTVTPLTRS